VTCKKGDNIALFYPFKQNDYGVTPGNVSVSLDQNTVIENGNLVTGKQDGTIENIKYVDYSWGLAKNISTTDFKGWGTINFRKQYALLLVKFCNDGKPIKNIKSLFASIFRQPIIAINKCNILSSRNSAERWSSFFALYYSRVF